MSNGNKPIAAEREVPHGDVELSERIARVERQIGKSGRLTVVSAVAAILFGSGGAFALVRWVFIGPSITRRLNQVELETRTHDLTEKQLGDQVTRESAKLALLQQKIEFESKLHRESIDSLTNELADAKAVGNRTLIRNLAIQLADRERAYQSVLEQLPHAFQLQAVDPLSSSLRGLIDQSKAFELRMRALAAGGDLAPNHRENASADTSALIMADRHSITFPPNQRVTILAHVPAGKTLVVVGSLSLDAIGLKNMEHFERDDPRVFIALTDQERAEFRTPYDSSVELRLTFAKLQDSPFRTLQVT